MTMQGKNSCLISAEVIESRILFVRGRKVIIDKDLAGLYEIKTMALNQAVKRNIERFPKSFMFQLNGREKRELITNCDRFVPLKHSSHLPYVFTEQGVAMLSSVLKSRRAIQVNILIMETFVRLRRLINSHKRILHKMDELEKKYDAQFKIVFDALRKIIEPPPLPGKRIGFLRDGEVNNGV